MQLYEDYEGQEDREAPFAVFSEEDNLQYIEKIVSEEPPVRWWAEQVLYEERQRMGQSDKLDALIKARLEAQGGTVELGLALRSSSEFAIGHFP